MDEALVSNGIEWINTPVNGTAPDAWIIPLVDFSMSTGPYVDTISNTTMANQTLIDLANSTSSLQYLLFTTGDHNVWLPSSVWTSLCN
jgi:hypothetical protein